MQKSSSSTSLIHLIEGISVHYFVDFNKNDKTINSKNDSEQKLGFQVIIIRLKFKIFGQISTSLFINLFI